MGQLDPLVAWQKDGFAMFGDMIDAVDDDYLRYVMHVQVVSETAAEPDLTRASYQAAEDPVQGASLLEAMRGTITDEPNGNGSGNGAGPMAAASSNGGGPGAGGAAPGRPQGDGETMAPLVKAPTEKIGRNEPCWCGSGKKFKLCHGAV
jgi:preprotein translocase subunit SecA